MLGPSNREGGLMSEGMGPGWSVGSMADASTPASEEDRETLPLWLLLSSRNSTALPTAKPAAEPEARASACSL